MAKDLAAALRKTREKLSESQAEFAKRFGVNQATISRWEESGPSGGPAKIAVEQILHDIDRFVRFAVRQ
jgi:transcriptional regulator with XRE-family HTH domain